MEKTALTAAAAKIAEASLKAAFGAWAEKAASKLVEQAAADIPETILSIVPNVAREAASVSATSVAGPLLKLLFRLTDQTAARLDKLVGEPYKTGMREAERALAPPTGSTDNETWRRSCLHFADTKLASAFTLAEKTKGADQTRLHISFVRALIALAAGADEFSKHELTTASRYVDHHLTIIEADIESISRQFRNWGNHATDGREYPGASGLYSRREDLRRRRMNLLELREFLQSCLLDFDSRSVREPGPAGCGGS